ncbi:hypothetical protein [Frisingicoccus sp.]|uniref:hypothetical protein n=1 Tax=Frisingicoccus sp. TaxID=1918627 RepID=UPI003AB5C74C
MRNRKGMDMNEEYVMTPYETREILFYKTDNGELVEKAVISKMETTAANADSIKKIQISIPNVEKISVNASDYSDKI